MARIVTLTNSLVTTITKHKGQKLTLDFTNGSNEVTLEYTHTNAQGTTVETFEAALGVTAATSLIAGNSTEIDTIMDAVWTVLLNNGALGTGTIGNG